MAISKKHIGLICIGMLSVGYAQAAPLHGLQMSLSLSMIGSSSTDRTVSTTPSASTIKNDSENGSSSFGAKVEAIYTAPVNDRINFGTGVGAQLSEATIGDSNFTTASNGVQTTSRTQIKRKAGDYRAFIQPEIVLTGRTAVTMRLGYATAKLDVKRESSSLNNGVQEQSASNGATKVTVGGMMYGVGIRTLVTPEIAIHATIDKIDYKEKEGIKAEAIEGSIGLSVLF